MYGTKNINTFLNKNKFWFLASKNFHRKILSGSKIKQHTHTHNTMTENEQKPQIFKLPAKVSISFHKWKIMKIWVSIIEKYRISKKFLLKPT